MMRTLLETLAMTAVAALLFLALFGCVNPANRGPTMAANAPPVSQFPLTIYADPALGVHLKSLRLAAEDFPCGMFKVSKKGRVRIRIPDGFPWSDTTASYLGFVKTLGHAAGLVIDPPERPIIVIDHPTAPRITGVMHVSVMASNLGAHLNRLDYGFLLPELMPEDREALKARYCERRAR